MGKGKKKKKKKYRRCIIDDDYDYYYPDNYYSYTTTSATCSVSTRGLSEDMVPKSMRLSTQDSGICLGKLLSSGWGSYAGITQGTEGNVIVTGGNGSGKSSGIAKPTLKTWKGAICATDIKGELSDFYKELYEKRLVTRPFIVFDPMNPECPSYDPYDWLIRDGEANLVSNIWEIALAIIPVLPNDIQPFWAEAERGGICSSTAVLLYVRA